MNLVKNLYKKIKNLYDIFLYNKSYKNIFDTNKILWDDDKPLAILIGFNPWKREYMKEYLAEYNLCFVKGKTSSYQILKGLRNIKSDYSNYKVYIWSYKEKKLVYKYLKLKKISISRVEDGFIRSIGLGSNRAKPLSIVIDNDSLYLDVSRESKLEKIIQKSYKNYTQSQISEAKIVISSIKKHQITKYNFIQPVTNTDDLDLLFDNDRKNILVIGQVEDDMSIQLGCQEPKTLEDLLFTAVHENLDANILYKIHPDILENRRTNHSDLELLDKVTIVPPSVHLHQLLERCDHVYTITSLSGFEALLYRKKVTCLGTPFYSQWGLTDDREINMERREKVSLTLEELVYSTLIDYPTYLEGNVEKTIDVILKREGSSRFDFEENFCFYNKELDLIKLKTIKNKKLALVTTSSDIGEIYLNLNSESDVTVFPTTLVISKAIHEKNIILPEKCFFLNKYFMEPLSNMENTAVNLSQSIAYHLQSINQLITKNIFEEDENKVFSQIHSEYIEDSVFNDCALYLSLQELQKDYDYIIFYDKGKKQNSLYPLFKNPSYEKKVLFTFKRNDNMFNDMNIIKNSITPKLDSHYNSILDAKIDQIRVGINKCWNAEKLENINNISCLDSEEEIVICGHLTDKNYAYYPASKEILKLGIKNKKIKFLPSSFLNPESEENQKIILFEDMKFNKSINLYPLLIREVMENNNFLGERIKNILKSELHQIYYTYLHKRIPNELLNLIEHRVAISVDKLALHLALYFEMERTSSSTILYLTTMERTLISRLYMLTIQKKNIKTIGIQPQIISTSKRYRKPLVDMMLVIDPLQEENYRSLGYMGEIAKIGSANLRKHLNLIQLSDTISKRKSKINILFIMQHSMAALMYQAVQALKNINQTIHIYLKPHPMQETQVLEETSSQINSCDNITLLDKDEDTYQYIKYCNVIVGLFSSVMYEAILAKKDVVILKLEEIDPSIDFVRTEACAEATNLEDLEKSIESFLNNDRIAQEIRSKQIKYINKNSYIYSTEKVRKLILKELSNE